MGIFGLTALLITLAAIFSYVNHRFIGLPTTIGVMLIAIVLSGGLLLAGLLGLSAVGEQAEALVGQIDFSKTLLNGMLSFLLFAGALHVNLEDLARRKWIISILATVGLALSALLVALATRLILGALGIELAFIFCLLFGILIAPTDPVAVLSILRKAGVPKSLEAKVTGESLFNDGVAVVVYIVLLEVAKGDHVLGLGHVALLFVVEAVGGVLFGLVTGWLAYLMLKSVDNYQVEVLITLALVTGGYALADALHMSGPIAMVVAGLLIGNRGRYLAMSDTTRVHLDSFWELVDEVLNAVLFLIIGLEVLVITFEGRWLLAGVLMIPLVLTARFISVATPVTLLRPLRDFSPRAIRVLTWGGLRGGISVALALALPRGLERDLLLTITYTIVVFSILVQGPTIQRVVGVDDRLSES